MTDSEKIARGPEAPFSLDVDLRIHSLMSVKKACYRFADRFDIQLTQSSAEHVSVVFRPLGKDAPTGSRLAELASQLRREILDQDLRESIFEQTKEVRTLILAEAFSNTGLLEP